MKEPAMKLDLLYKFENIKQIHNAILINYILIFQYSTLMIQSMITTQNHTLQIYTLPNYTRCSWILLLVT